MLCNALSSRKATLGALGGRWNALQGTEAFEGVLAVIYVPNWSRIRLASDQMRWCCIVGCHFSITCRFLLASVGMELFHATPETSDGHMYLPACGLGFQTFWWVILTRTSRTDSCLERFTGSICVGFHKTCKARFTDHPDSSTVELYTWFACL